MSEGEAKSRDTDDDYAVLKQVLDALLAHRFNTALEPLRASLVDRGYLFRDARGSFRLTDKGKVLLREGTRKVIDRTRR